MPTTLLVTVGGSPQPILTAIETLRPERVIFVCSAGKRGSETQVTGSGTPCEIRRGSEVIERLPNLPTQAKLGQFDAVRDVVRLENPDDLSECYQRCAAAIRACQQTQPEASLIADYTGGTKTMSLALALAALDYGVKLYLTTNTTRQNLIRVERGEATELARTSLVKVERTLDQTVPRLLAQYNYPAAIAELRDLGLTGELPTATRQRIGQLRDCCEGLDAWDRFDHREAWSYLQNAMSHETLRPLGLFLRQVMASRGAIDPDFDASEGSPGHGYELVLDLQQNAARRAAQNRYDDAVGRLYRALELLAQLRLRQAYNIQTGDVDVTQLPANLQDTYRALTGRQGKVQLALTRSYILLSELPDDPLGQLYQTQQAKLMDALQIRNYSLFAHGFQPITQTAYEQVESAIGGFLRAGVTALTDSDASAAAPQFPQTLAL